MIAITGSNGNIGRHLAHMLAKSGTPARLLMRTPDKASAVGDGLEGVAADLDRPATLDAALEGITRLFLLSPGPNIPAQDAAAIAAAHRAGLQHIVLLSSIGVRIDQSKAAGRTHAPGERLLMDSGINWTILRPSEFMTNTLWWLPEIEARGTISVPSGKGRVGFIDPADIAAVAFAALTSPGPVGKVYHLTGPDALSTAEVAAQLASLAGKPVRHVDVSDAVFRAGAAHMPEPVVEVLSEYYGVVKEGRMEVLSPDVEQVTGHRPSTLADWAQSTIAVGSA